MKHLLPGTTIGISENTSAAAFDLLSPILSVTKGLTLGQLCELTGLEGSTIQNWVKRGWVANPETRRYGEDQVVRVILINMLRNSLQLEKIVALMQYLNGKVEDRSDDIIPDRELWNILCSIILKLREIETTNRESIKAVIDREIKNYSGPFDDSKQKLKKALLCMTFAYISSEIKKQAEDEFEQLFSIGQQ